MTTNNKTSLLIPYQLPEFIRDDPSYANFVLFLQAYYEWLETSNQITDRTKNILNYKDIDSTTSEFLNYFYNDFLSYFPQEVLQDPTKNKATILKVAKQLYQAKGTSSSYKFLFRILFNSDVDIFYTKDAVLKTSAGKWYVTQSMSVLSNDDTFLNIANLRVFGETSKASATIENSSFTGTKFQIFVSDTKRTFISGETIRIIDADNQDVYFLGGNVVPKGTYGAYVLTGKIVGQVAKIVLNATSKGLLYQPGDPIVFYGGLSSNTGLGASAVVSTTQSGSIQRILVNTGGYGYTATPNTVINLTGAATASATVGSLDPSIVSNVSFVITNIVDNVYATVAGSNGIYSSTKIYASNYGNIFPANTSANISASLANTFSTTSFLTYPISSILVTKPGSNISSVAITTQSLYQTLDANTKVDLANMGILAPIKIVSGGTGYRANDKIVISGGTGYGAYANVITVDSANGNTITSVSYVYPPNDTAKHRYPLGGMGYKLSGLPTANVTSANGSASGAVLSVPGILGAGATFTASTDKIGQISSITLTALGEDYISTPNVSFVVQDLAVTNVASTNLPRSGDIIYQGTSLANSSYAATVDSIFILSALSNPTNSIYNVRVYNYNSKPNFNLPLKIDTRNASLILNGTAGGRYGSSGVITYGDGTARGTATIQKGLTSSQGQYLDTSGQLSSYDVLQSVDFNNFTYELSLEKEIEKYRNILLGLLHPAGMKVLGRYYLNGANSHNFTSVSASSTGHTLSYYTGNPGSSATMTADFVNQSNNIVKFTGLSGSNLPTFIAPGNTLKMTNANGDIVYAEVTGSIDGTANTVTLKDNVWLTFANVAYAIGNSGSSVINISSLTNSYNVVNNGKYSNTAYPLHDIVRAGDKVLLANNTSRQVANVDYSRNIIYLTTTLSANSGNSLLSVNRTFTTSNVIIYGPLGIQYVPELTTEDGRSLVTEDGTTLILLG